MSWSLAIGEGVFAGSSDPDDRSCSRLEGCRCVTNPEISSIRVDKNGALRCRTDVQSITSTNTKRLQDVRSSSHGGHGSDKTQWTLRRGDGLFKPSSSAGYAAGAVVDSTVSGLRLLAQIGTELS